MDRSDRRLYSTAFLAGLVLVPTRFTLAFFPLFNLVEILLFAATAAGLAYYFRVRPSWWTVLLFLPTFLVTLYVVLFWLGAGSLLRGVGVGHVVSLVLIPLSAFAGARYGGKTTNNAPLKAGF
jgi:hypothetical protein